jgi:AcrR family transcriptional regulator
MSADAAPEGIRELRGPADRASAPRVRSNREALEEAAWEVFSEQPYAEVRIATIAARAGVSMGTFYSYFDSKESLFRVAAGRALEELYSYPRQDPDNPQRNPIRDLSYSILNYFRVCLGNRIIARSIEQVWSQDDGVRRNRRGTLMRGAKRLERWIIDLQDKGICDPSVNPWLTALALQSMTVQLAYDQLVYREQPQDVDALVEAVVPIWAKAVGLYRWLPKS